MNRRPWCYKKSNARALLVFLPIIFSACSISRQISKQATRNILSDSALSAAHVGVSLYEPASGKYWYNHQADKYFIPASNTKLFSLYAGMKYLPDSIPAVRYAVMNDTLFILPAGDPTFLHRDFKSQRVYEFLKRTEKNIAIIKNNWKENALGSGWSWDDYNDDYMVERSPMPIYGNVIRWSQVTERKPGSDTDRVIVLSQPRAEQVTFYGGGIQKGFFAKRNFAGNTFFVVTGGEKHTEQETPFVTEGIKSAVAFLEDTLNKHISISASVMSRNFSVLYSQPSDSLFKIMMHRSDNFFAEQTLLMAGNERLGYMNDKEIIDTLLQSDLKELPQRPVWVDGSGLSRYNLFTPEDFVYILSKMKNDFGLERLKNILPTGGTGTLQHYYRGDSGFIYAKTGTLSNVAAISGYLITKKNKLLVFSVLANNFATEAVPFRKAAEKFLTGIRRRY